MKTEQKTTDASKRQFLHKRDPAKNGSFLKKAGWEKAAYTAGSRSVGWFWPISAYGEPPADLQWARRLNVCWADWFLKFGFNNVTQSSYPHACRRFIRGFCETANINVSCDLLFPTTKTVGCIITVMDESELLQVQLNELGRLPFDEIIVVLNGSVDNCFKVAREHPSQATIVSFDAALGFDVGRAVGAKVSSSDVLLFLDGDMLIRADLLLPFIYEVECGADVVLNPISSLLPPPEQRDPVSNVKQFLNICLGRKDLQADSLTAVPHALSRGAIERLGTSVLTVPPVAHERAIWSGLKVVSLPAAVNAIHSNRIRKQNAGLGNQVEQLILGDHLEALHELMKSFGPRLRFPDDLRQRDFIEEEEVEDVENILDHPDS